jgi:hypothetical protein
MGWTVRLEYGKHWSVPLESSYFRQWDGENVESGTPPFDTNIADAWEVFNTFTDAKLEKVGDMYLVDIGEEHIADNENKCVAICLAALRTCMTDAEIGEALK